MADIINMSKKDLGQYFDQSIIGCYTEDQVRKLAQNAVDYNMRVVHPCNPHYVGIVKEVIAGSNVLLGSGGIGFPMGDDTPAVKAKCTLEMVAYGAQSLDLTMNYPALINGNYKLVEEELRLFSEITKGLESKCIIEVCHLTEDQIHTASKMVIEAGIGFVKSSTGQLQGPTIQQVCIIVEECKGTDTKCKVAGVKFPRPQNAAAFLKAGAERIGSQACVEIIEGIQFMNDKGLL